MTSTVAPASSGAWDGRGPYPATASTDAHHVLSEYHHYRAIRGLVGAAIAEAETGAGIETQAARLAAALGELLTENAVLRVLAAPAVSAEVPVAPTAGPPEAG